MPCSVAPVDERFASIRGELAWWYAPEVPVGFNGRWLRRHGSGESKSLKSLSEDGSVVTGVASEEPVGRWLRRHVGRCPEGRDGLLQDGSVVMAPRSLMRRRVGRSPEAADGSRENVLTTAFLDILMGCSEDGSIVTWGDVLKVLMGYWKLAPSLRC